VTEIALQGMCDRWGGFLRQICCDEKGFVMIFAFGMPGAAAGHAASRSVLASLDVRQAIIDSTGLKVRLHANRQAMTDGS
jgi:hypothetical protein